MSRSRGDWAWGLYRSCARAMGCALIGFSVFLGVYRVMYVIYGVFGDT